MVVTETSPDVTTGDLLVGKYRLQAPIGRGAMGTVWRALNENLGQPVAVKIISPEHAGSAELRERFDTEARAAAKLNSRFVVSVYDNGVTTSGLPFIVMELLHGECLEERVLRQGALPLPQVTRIARHLSRALSKAHAQGIVHRDLKPANIFITHSDAEEDGDDWTAKVLDFGIAKMDEFRERATTQTGTVLGTPLFMAPEQVRGANLVDARADLYSFGMVVFNMLTGTFAFEGQSFGDLLVSICVDPLPDIRKFAPHLPQEMSAWFQKACSRDPSQRFSSAEEVFESLQVALGEQSSAFSATHSSPWSAPPPLVAPEQQARWPSQTATSPHLDSASASSITVHDTPKRSRKLLFALGAVAVLFGIGVLSALRFGLSTQASASAQQPAILEIPDPVRDGTEEKNEVDLDSTTDGPTVKNKGTKPGPPMELEALPVEEDRRKAAPRPITRPKFYPRPRAAPEGTPDLGF